MTQEQRAENLLPSLRIALLDCAKFDGRYCWKPAAMEKLKAMGLTMQVATNYGVRWGLTDKGRETVAAIKGPA